MAYDTSYNDNIGVAKINENILIKFGLKKKIKKKKKKQKKILIF